MKKKVKKNEGLNWEGEGLIRSSCTKGVKIFGAHLLNVVFN